MSHEECRGMTHFTIYTAAYEPLVSVLAHEYEFAFIAAITHLNSWSEFRQNTSTVGLQPKQNAPRNDSGSTIPHMLTRSFLNANFVSPPPRIIPQMVGNS